MCSYICVCMHIYTHKYIHIYTHTHIRYRIGANDLKSSNEDDVWVVGSMFDAVSNRACVGIFDGDDLSKGM
jgi:carotenoid cleavage dioxygenase-like enzyme